jgi:hypothetical protein
MKLCLAFSFLFVLVAAGCREPGRVRVSDDELVETYVLDFQNIVKISETGQKLVAVRAKEQLTLNPDKTYHQVFSSAARQFTNHGAWKSSNQFLGGTEIELTGVNLPEDEPADSPLSGGNLFLQVHGEKGKLKLARNEVADLYYHRVQ